jgi:hypothetical protein
MLEDNLQFLIKDGCWGKHQSGYLRAIYLLLNEIQYKINSSQEELRGTLYSALM